MCVCVCVCVCVFERYIYIERERERIRGKVNDIIKNYRGFPGGTVVESLPANAGDTGSSPGLGRSTCRGVTRPVSHNY